jgi:hypothetical protein
MPFLTDDAAEVVPWVNLSIVAGMVANLASLVRDRPWVRALGDLATSVLSCVVLLQLLRVFPFDVSGDDEWQGATVRIVLWLLVAGTAIGAVVSLVALARRTTGASGTTDQG